MQTLAMETVEPTGWKDFSKVSLFENTPSLPTSIPLVPRTIDELMRQRSEETPNLHLISYPSSGINYVTYTARQLDTFAFRVAKKYALTMPPRCSSSKTASVIGLLGPSNLDYLVTILALTKLGHTVLFLSTRISSAAYESLLHATGATHLLIDDSFKDIAESFPPTSSALKIDGIASIDVYGGVVPTAETDTSLTPHLDLEVEKMQLAWIIHSSGSTGLPKPIFQTQNAAMGNYQNNMNMKGFVTLPLYHAHGISSLFRSIQSRKSIHLYNASLPLTHDYLLNTLQQNDLEIFYGVPYALKLLAESEEGLEALAKLKVVMFGGSACPDTLGNRLVQHGVNLVSHYGTTETGQLMTSFRATGDKDWDYVRLSPDLEPYISFQMKSEGIYELVALEGLPSKVASNRPDGSYATKDLFTPHPVTPNAWKYYARMDDTIVLLNGEKHVPTAFEQMVRDNVNVVEAVLVGSSRPRVGMIIIPSSSTIGMTEKQILKLVTPVINQANEDAPGYAKLSLDMVKILPAETVFPRTDKGTVIRAAFYKQFSKDIDAIYDASEVLSGDLILSEDELIQYIRTKMVQLLSLKDHTILGDDTDFFSLGVDSLMAIQLRGMLSKKINTGGQKLGSNIVFDYPTLRSLARKLYCLRTGDKSEAISVEDQMAALISKYSVFDQHVPVANEPEGQYLVVTGATGSLGAHVISQLANLDNVKRIYCLVRASSEPNARTRVIQSLRARALYHTLPPSARSKIIALPSNFGDTNLGLDAVTYTQISSEITSLIHCAWSVNFNLGLGSFEDDCIAGAHNLINLCLKSHRPTPATFNFCSSVSAVASTKGALVPEELPLELSYAQNMGYARSKLVTENICIRAGKTTSIQARVLRIGQVVGDTVHGIWNETEAIPMMLQAATTIGAIPRLDERPLWLPVDTVACGVVDIALSDAGAGVMNLVNHQSFHWTEEFLPLLREAGLVFEEVGQREWIERLRVSVQDPVLNPPIKLLEFFEGKYDNDTKKSGLTYETGRARSFSSALAKAPRLDRHIVEKFVSHWMSTSWAKAPTCTRRNQVIVLMGSCEPCTSTVAQALKQKYNVPWIEAEAQNPPTAPKTAVLTEKDDQAWLSRIKDTALTQLSETEKVAVLTCSELNADHRAGLQDMAGKENLDITFFILQTEGGRADGEVLGTGETDCIPFTVTGGLGKAQGEIDALFEDVTGMKA